LCGRKEIEFDSEGVEGIEECVGGEVERCEGEEVKRL